MLITKEKVIILDEAIEKFFKAIGKKERIRNRINKLAEKNYKAFLPKVRVWMEFTISEINKALREKYIRKSAGRETEYYAWIDFEKDKAIDITTKLLDWEKLNEDGKRMLKPAGLDIMAKSGDEAYKIAGIEASFDILNPEAVKAVDKICSKLVKEVNKETKQAINHVIREGIKEGKSMGRVAKELRALKGVGLTERQIKAVGNYEKWLEKHRPDLSPLKRADWVKRYNNKLHRYRTDMIARTESMRATNEGNLIGYKDAGYATVRWSANVGACDYCDIHSGHVYTIEESRGMLPAHPSCRCSWLPESKEKPKRKVSLENMLAKNKITSRTTEGYIRGVNNSSRIRIEGDGEAIFKTRGGELPGIVERMGGNGTECARERVAYILSKEMGIKNVPITVLREVEGEFGSVQFWIKKTKARVASGLELSDYSAYMRAKVFTEYSKEKARMEIFDILIGNYDRHKGNYLIGNKMLYYIDNGFSMPNGLTYYTISAGRFKTEVVAPHVESAFKLLGKDEMIKVKASLGKVRISKALEKEMTKLGLHSELGHMNKRADILLEIIDDVALKLGEELK